MAQAVRRSTSFDGESLPLQLWQRVREGAFIAFGGVAVFVLVALATHHQTDPGWSHTGANGYGILNSGGIAGAWLADILFYVCGRFAYVFPAMTGYSGWLLYRERQQRAWIDYPILSVRTTGFVLTLFAGCALMWVRTDRLAPVAPSLGGGVLGDLVGHLTVNTCGHLGGVLLMLAGFLAGVTLFSGLSWLRVMDAVGHWTLRGHAHALLVSDWILDYFQGLRARRDRAQLLFEDTLKQEARAPLRIEPHIVEFIQSERPEKEKQKFLFQEPVESALPTLSLLDEPRQSGAGYSTEALEAISRLVELKLKDFGIDVEVVAIVPGPVITRFELMLAPGIKASRITGLSKDLARSLSTVSVRVVEVIPGKAVIGLEIPNERREIVSLSEVLKAREYEESESPLTLALGKDIAGKPVVVDLARMPHLLVAGTTGSGKSVALNAMILSLLYKATANDVRLIMIDPKMLELSVYEGIPGLLAPVVTDMKEAANALRWCVGEMERRYRLMSALGVRNIGGYNRKVSDAIAAGKPILDPLFDEPESEAGAPALGALPYVVVIVDELADMMMTVGKKVEELIARLAQKARAAGIHLILATQRPSVDVITGLIKANIPTRIAFQVSSRIDSRTILDQMGAENLLGHGDMLYLPPGTATPQRIHGAFVSDQEVHKVVEQLKAIGTPEYVSEIVNPGLDFSTGDGFGESEESDEGEGDELYDQAVCIVTESRRASVSGIQRRLKIGYNRAARMVEEMERAGVVGQLQSNGSREVLAPPPPRG
ncbi:MAG: DNA translocase FtsK [Gammaproteobacteria bacterium]|nr:DNA translocase FtsK [Gammaproteobacteria bacterium]